LGGKVGEKEKVKVEDGKLGEKNAGCNKMDEVIT
jgi:hypothetical protein